MNQSISFMRFKIWSLACSKNVITNDKSDDKFTER